MRYLLTLLVCVLLVSVSSCRKDFETLPSFGQLQFSKDTVFLDTVFTNIGSATFNLKVYNRSNNAITVPRIALENGVNSNYRLNVDGIPGKEFEAIDILAKDSIFIFVETTIDVNSVADPLYTDRILFDNGNNQQDVDLVTLVRDANFIFPGKDAVTMKIDSLTLNGQPTTLQGRFLTDQELTFTNNKPTVIYGFAAVPANKTLTIEAGANIHFHDNSGLIVDNQATLKVNGTLAEKVTFEGDRLESAFDNIPGQWGTIWLRAGSKENEIKHTIIKNGIVGILVDSIGSSNSPTLAIENTEIYNNSSYGILARQASISGNNVVIGDAGQVSFAGTIGGDYRFTHSTFANYWNNSLRQLPAVLINNFFSFTDENGQEIAETRDLTGANFINCIFDGNNDFEFLLDRLDGSTFNYLITNSLIKFAPTSEDIRNIPEMNFEGNVFYRDNIINGFPDFRDRQNNDFIIGQNSDAINNATTSPFTLDILGVDRTNAPDIGAYQNIVFEEEE